MTVPTKTRITPARPGIMMSEVFSSGLYRICTLTFLLAVVLVAAPLPPRPRADSARRAACAANNWLPSMRTCGVAAPVTIATAACPSRSWPRAQAIGAWVLPV